MQHVQENAGETEFNEISTKLSSFFSDVLNVKEFFFLVRCTIPEITLNDFYFEERNFLLSNKVFQGKFKGGKNADFSKSNFVTAHKQILF